MKVFPNKRKSNSINLFRFSDKRKEDSLEYKAYYYALLLCVFVIVALLLSAFLGGYK